MTRTDDGFFQEKMKVTKGIVNRLVEILRRKHVIVEIGNAIVNDHMTLTMQRNDGAPFSVEEKDQIRKVMLSDDCKKTVGSTLSRPPFEWKKVRIRVCSRENGNKQYIWSLEKGKEKK